MSFRESGAPTIEPGLDSLSPERQQVPEMLADTVEQAQGGIRAIEACRGERDAVLDMFSRLINDTDHRRVATREVLGPLSTLKEALETREVGILHDIRKLLADRPQAFEYLDGPEDILRELAPKR